MEIGMSVMVIVKVLLSEMSIRVRCQWWWL